MLSWNSLNKYPFIWVAIFFISGILSEHYLNILSNSFFLLILISISLITITLSFLMKKVSFSNRLVIFVFSYFMGMLYLGINNKNIKYPFKTPKIRNTWVKGKIEHIDLLSSKKISFDLNVHRYKNEEVNIKLRCSVWKDSTAKIDSIYSSINIGDSVKIFGSISEPRNMRNPGEFDYQEYLYSQGISGIFNCYNVDSIKIISRGNYSFYSLIFDIRKSIDERITKYYNKETASLLKAILLADRKDIDYSVKESFVNTGVIHVLAVSGLHVGYIILIFQLFFGRLPIRIRFILTIVALLFFVILTEAQPSVFRASTMAVVYLLAKLLNRSSNGFNAISIAAVIILLFNPYEIFSPGFQLSFSAVISILLFYPIFKQIIDRINIGQNLKRILLFSSVSIAAQIGTLPFTIAYFEKLAIISLVANLIVIPFFGAILALGIGSLFLSLLLPLLVKYFAYANMILVHFVFSFVHVLSKLTFAYINIYNFTFHDSLIYLFCIVVCTFLGFQIKRKIILFISIIFICIGSYFLMSLDNTNLLRDGKLSVLAIDVGQGDSFLLKFPNGKTALIDAGNRTEYFDNGSRIIEPLLKRLSIEKINYAFLSHLDSDHYLGSIYLIQNSRIDTVYLPKNNTIVSHEFIKFLNYKKIPYRFYSQQKLRIGNCTAYILNDVLNNSYKHFDENNKSGIIKFVYGKNSFLFVGDAEIEAEQYLIRRYGEFLKSDVLKVGHHGSNTSTSKEFLNFVHPKIGLISAGVMNKFKHPSKRIVELLKKFNVKILRTDVSGAILLVSDGNSIQNVDWRN